MVRKVPYGLQVGQIVVPLVNSEMTNGKMALLGVRYRVCVVYPGGVIVKSANLDGNAPTLSDGDYPSGLLRAGTPVKVEGEPEPTPEELAKIGMPVLAQGGSLDDLEKPRPVGQGVWDWRVDPGRAVSTPRQAAVVCEILVESGKTEFLESEILALMREHGAKFNSKQDPTHIFRYYKKDLERAGFLAKRS